MWSAVAALAFVVGAFTWTNEPQLASDAGVPGGPSASTLPTLLLVVRIPSGDALAKHRIAELIEQSATAREMLELLGRSPQVFVSLRSTAKLWQFTGANGRGTVHVAGGQIFASLEFDSRCCVARQLRAIAHELAHTVEIASMEQIHSTAALRSKLQEAAARRLPGVLMRDYETLFAISVEDRVATELRSDRQEGRLAKLAAMHRVRLH